MHPEQLRQLRESRGLTREQLAAELGDCSSSTVNKWERGMHDIPAWVEEKMLSNVRIQFPLSELHELLDLARAEDLSFEDLLAEAIRELVKSRRSHPKPQPQQAGQDNNTPAKTHADSPSNITHMHAPNPQQHHHSAAEEPSAASNIPPASKVSYGSGQRRSSRA
jgi:transcriptional regulator with XRE-family HTH domain